MWKYPVLRPLLHLSLAHSRKRYCTAMLCDHLLIFKDLKEGFLAVLHQSSHAYSSWRDIPV